VAYVISSHNNTPRNKTPDGVFIIVSGIRNSASGAEMGKMEIKNKLRRWLARKNNEKMKGYKNRGLCLINSLVLLKLMVFYFTIT
jgi:uncharacterized membrane protein YidH (DUF202 family)